MTFVQNIAQPKLRMRRNTPSGGAAEFWKTKLSSVNSLLTFQTNDKYCSPLRGDAVHFYRGDIPAVPRF